jgi:urease subunit gamma
VTIDLHDDERIGPPRDGRGCRCAATTVPDQEAPVHLTPADTEKLLLAVAGMVARDRLERGVKLNYPETVALLTTWVIERARDGRSVADLMAAGREVLSRDQVMEGVAEMLPDVQVEATFPDGRKLVTIHHPIA